MGAKRVAAGNDSQYLALGAEQRVIVPDNASFLATWQAQPGFACRDARAGQDPREILKQGRLLGGERHQLMKRTASHLAPLPAGQLFGRKVEFQDGQIRRKEDGCATLEIEQSARQRVDASFRFLPVGITDQARKGPNPCQDRTAGRRT